MLVPTTSPMPVVHSLTTHPKLLAVGSSMTGPPSCICPATLQAMNPACVLVILAARNVNFCSPDCALTKEVLADWLWLSLSCQLLAGFLSLPGACWITYSLAAWKRLANTGASTHVYFWHLNGHFQNFHLALNFCPVSIQFGCDLFSF